ncbi:Mss4-like protein [Rhodofomes roseus]|uniref:Mss4-like protein n=1 Tax=Rhodofomes roseus TaxID=34475 RepID=A0ABQ8KPP7_9APHY|nr:Mss4-like protein [Rhodofomes roseus]KAH9839827.1 Mss4-like protein [Rhodofomes roseus]
MPTYNGGCYCGNIRYELSLDSPDQARMSICHCTNCKKFTGSAFGITAKIPASAFRLRKGQTTHHVGDNGSGTQLTREFCGACGSGVLEYGAHAGENVYLFYGSLDEPDALPPKGEFFCKERAQWLPEIPGLFHKREVKE